jgi:hypothetical protein
LNDNPYPLSLCTFTALPPLFMLERMRTRQ